MITKLKQNIDIFFSTIFAILLYHLHYGIGTAIFTNINWLLKARHDWGAHYLGFCFYRNSDWSFPIGNINKWYYPIGTNVGLTDSIPLFAIPFKALSSLLPIDFQYIGFFILISYILNGYFTVKFTRLFTDNKFLIILSSLFVLISPIVIYRAIHPSLCAHWLIIGSMYIYFKPENNKAESYTLLKKQLILLILSALIHPYITFIIIGFTVILPLKFYLDKKYISFKNTIIYIVLSLISLLIVWAILGVIFNSTMSVNTGYGLYSWNFNSFFNPDGFSSILPQLKKYSDRQYEGYSYLGVGMMVLIIISTVIFIINILRDKLWIKRNKKTFLIFLVWLLPLTLFGITNVFTFNDQLLFTFPIPSIIEELGGVFRASSRFIWLLYYSIFLGSLFIFIKSKISNPIKFGILSAIFCLQFYDIKFLQTYRELELGKYENPLDEKTWSKIFSNFEHVSFYPIYTWDLINHYDYQDFANLAYQNNNTFTSAYAARTNFDKEQEATKNLLTLLNNNKIDNNTVYITNKDNLSAFTVVLSTGQAKAIYIDEYFVIYSSKKNLKIDLSSKNQKITNSIMTEYVKSNSFKFRKIDNLNKVDIKHNIEFSLIKDKYAMFKGWTTTTNKNPNMNDSIFIVYNHNNKFYLANTDKIKRDDIGNLLKDKNKSFAGFSSTIFVDQEIFNNYPIGIIIKDQNSNYFYQEIDKSILAKDFSKIKEVNLPKLCSEDYIYNFDKITKFDEYVELFGWVANTKIDNQKVIKSIILKNGDKNYIVQTEKIERTDVQNANKNLINGAQTGFIGKFELKSIPNGKYKVFIQLKNIDTKETCYITTNTTFDK